MPAASDRGDLVAPNPNLVVQGIPPIPRSLAEQVARYTDFAGHRFVDWHPTRREMLVAHRRPGAATTQIFRVDSALAAPQQLTESAEPVRTASYEPVNGDYIVFERSSGGDEAAQLHRLDLATMRTTQLTAAGERHDMQAWLNRSPQLLYLSLPLDRTAAGGSRSSVTQTLSIVDPSRPESRRRLAELPGGGWDVGAVSWDDRLVTLNQFVSVAESRVWLLDLGSGERRQLLPGPGAGRSAHYGGVWKRDNSGFFLVSDRGGEFLELLFYRIADASLTRMSRTIPWDVEQPSLDSSGRLLAVRVNVEGRHEVRFFDADTFGELPSPALPSGSVVGGGFHRRLPALALTLDESKAAGLVGVLDPASGVLQRWTQPFTPPGIDPSRFGEQSIVRWKSFDGRTISGIANLPPARFTGKRPVLIQVHGGPENQATFGFIGRLNYHVEELGIAVIQPNVRGSSGFGKTFLTLDNGMKREDAVKDIGALLDWIAAQPRLDAGRVLVAGGSYGGYMSLAVAVAYPERIAGAIDVVGISNFVSFLENTESYRRDLRRVEYGDERDPVMREFLTRISPLTRAERIRKPLFVVQGRNDPRVPYTEAEQIVARVRANGTPVWYLRAENEGHGFARKENADFQFYATVMFLRETLLKQGPGRAD
ncbi:MAG TPA: alpha/beta fold hydrolase [Caldimonas sp.]|nr:alpha/beta fold hydrolase [Caldimonas sp.]HEX2541886.1 alpha/beta fold hydrolase [Caldimonas sp.]